MQSPLVPTLILASCVLAAATAQREAHACGGCFHGADEATPSVVVGHRMALSISPERTVLWDQVEYTGDPEDFAWVLPVGSGAVLELADDAWFDALEAATATRVMSEIIDCPGGGIRQQESSGGSGCGSFGAGDPGDDGWEDDGEEDDDRRAQGRGSEVAVVHQATVGPYETVTLSGGANGAAIHEWLTDHGYVVPEDIVPILDEYVVAGSDFIALRLAPGAGVGRMQPVRVVTPGASPVLPLKMVAAGTGANTSLVLYVIGEGRYRAENFPEAVVPYSDLTWDWFAQSSNFTELRDEALSGAGWLATFARRRAFDEPIMTPDDGPARYLVGQAGPPGDDDAPSGVTTLADLYFAQAELDDGEAVPSCPSVVDELNTSKKIVTECSEISCDGEMPAEMLACGEYSDIATAFVGLHPRDVWVTRLEAMLPREALDRDLVIGASPSQVGQENWHVAEQSVNEPECPDTEPADEPSRRSSSSSGSCLCATPGASTSRAIMGLGLAGALALALARRGARRRPKRL